MISHYRRELVLIFILAFQVESQVFKDIGELVILIDQNRTSPLSCVASHYNMLLPAYSSFPSLLGMLRQSNKSSDSKENFDPSFSTQHKEARNETVSKTREGSTVLKSSTNSIEESCTSHNNDSSSTSAGTSASNKTNVSYTPQLWLGSSGKRKFLSLRSLRELCGCGFMASMMELLELHAQLDKSSLALSFESIDGNCYKNDPGSLFIGNIPVVNVVKCGDAVKKVPPSVYSIPSNSSRTARSSSSSSAESPQSNIPSSYSNILSTRSNVLPKTSAFCNQSNNAKPCDKSSNCKAKPKYKASVCYDEVLVDLIINLYVDEVKKELPPLMRNEGDWVVVEGEYLSRQTDSKTSPVLCSKLAECYADNVTSATSSPDAVSPSLLMSTSTLCPSTSCSSAGSDGGAISRHIRASLTSSTDSDAKTDASDKETVISDINTVASDRETIASDKDAFPSDDEAEIAVEVEHENQSSVLPKNSQESSSTRVKQTPVRNHELEVSPNVEQVTNILDGQPSIILSALPINPCRIGSSLSESSQVHCRKSTPESPVEREKKPKKKRYKIHPRIDVDQRASSAHSEFH